MIPGDVTKALGFGSEFNNTALNFVSESIALNAGLTLPPLFFARACALEMASHVVPTSFACKPCPDSIASMTSHFRASSSLLTTPSDVAPNASTRSSRDIAAEHV